MKRNYALIIVIIAALSFLIYYRYFSNSSSSDNFNPNSNEPIEITGILHTLDLEEEDKNSAMLIGGRYQLDEINSKDLRKLPENTNSLFIEQYEGNINNFIGKCITITGKVDNDWLSKTQDLRNSNIIAKSGIAFNAGTINKKEFTDCNGYGEKQEDNLKNIDLSQSKKIITGEIRRIERWDIESGNYDYVIVEGIEDNYILEDAVETSSTKKITQTFVVPTDNNIWQSFEKNMKKRVVLEGYETTDKRKKQVLYVTRIME